MQRGEPGRVCKMSMELIRLLMDIHHTQKVREVDWAGPLLPSPCVRLTMPSSVTVCWPGACSSAHFDQSPQSSGIRTSAVLTKKDIVFHHAVHYGH